MFIISETIKFDKTNIFIDEFTCTISSEDETMLEESDLVSFNAKKLFLNFSSSQKPVSFYRVIVFHVIVDYFLLARCSSKFFTLYLQAVDNSSKNAF